MSAVQYSAINVTTNEFFDLSKDADEAVEVFRTLERFVGGQSLVFVGIDPRIADVDPDHVRFSVRDHESQEDHSVHLGIDQAVAAAFHANEDQGTSGDRWFVVNARTVGGAAQADEQSP